MTDTLEVKIFSITRENLEHGNVTFNDNGTLTAIPLHPLTYIPEMSAGAEDDLLILPNIALLVSHFSILLKYLTNYHFNPNANSHII